MFYDESGKFTPKTVKEIVGGGEIVSLRQRLVVPVKK